MNKKLHPHAKLSLKRKHNHHGRFWASFTFEKLMDRKKNKLLTNNNECLQRQSSVTKVIVLCQMGNYPLLWDICVIKVKAKGKAKGKVSLIQKFLLCDVDDRPQFVIVCGSGNNTFLSKWHILNYLILY